MSMIDGECSIVFVQWKCRLFLSNHPKLKCFTLSKVSFKMKVKLFFFLSNTSKSWYVIKIVITSLFFQSNFIVQKVDIQRLTKEIIVFLVLMNDLSVALFSILFNLIELYLYIKYIFYYLKAQLNSSDIKTMWCAVSTLNTPNKTNALKREEIRFFFLPYRHLTNEILKLIYSV